MIEPVRFESRAVWRQTLHDALLHACAHAGRDMFWMDRDFADWPLSEPPLLEALSAWALPHRRLHLLAPDFDVLRQRHPRFVQWRRLHDHVVTASQFDPDDVIAPGGAEACMGLLLVPGLLTLSLRERHTWRGTLSAGLDEAVSWQAWFDAVAQRAVPAFGASVTGL